MARVQLSGGAYQARSVIASAQRSLNLYAEPMPQAQGEPAAFAYYPTPGLRHLATLPKAPVRALKQITNGNIYAVGGNTLYQLDWNSGAATAIGDLTFGRTNPVSMQDNGPDFVIVDGKGGWLVETASNSFAAITGPTGKGIFSDTGAFPASDAVDYIDTYLVFNQSGTPTWFWSESEAATFNPDLQFWIQKAGFSDMLTTLRVVKREIWLLGERSTEIYYNVGAADSPFQEQPGLFINFGCRAKYSPWVYENMIFWLAYDRAGTNIVMMGKGYEANKISTFAIDDALTKYPRVDDAVGMGYSLNGHAYYVLTFPSADKTWCYDVALQQWHEWCWMDTNGVEHRHRANCMFAVNGEVVVGDWQTGDLYALDPAVFTDNGAPIKRQRSFPHLLKDGNRIFYQQLIADIDPGWTADAIYPQELIRTTFTAADNTPLESYAYAGDVGRWSLVSGGAHVLDDMLTGDGVYQSNAVLNTPDYTVRFSVIPADYVTLGSGSVYLLARATDATHGYQVAVECDGFRYSIVVNVLGGTGSWRLGMGTIATGRYSVIAKFANKNIRISVRRSVDDLWLGDDGVWVDDTDEVCIAAADATYTGPGRIFLGWGTPTVRTAAPRDTLITIPQSALQPNDVYYTDIIGGGWGTLMITTDGGNAANVGDPTGRNDDGFRGPLDFGFSLPFYGNTYTQFYLNENGNISFNDGISAYTPTGPQGATEPIISAYFADLDSRGPTSGLCYYRQDIPNQLIITWDHTGYFDAHDDLYVSFQLIVRGPNYPVPPGEGFIGIFWKDMQWETGDASSGTGGFGGVPAAVGFGDGASNGMILEGSMANGIHAIVNHKKLWFDLGLHPIGPPGDLFLDDIHLTTTPTVSAQLLLAWSDDRGHTYGNPVAQDLGPRGDYISSLQYQRLGYARDRVFSLTWSCPARTALQGAWIVIAPAQS